MRWIREAARKRGEAESVRTLDRKAQRRVQHFAHRLECICGLEIFAVKAKEAHPSRIPTIEMGVVNGGVLEIAEHRADVSGIVFALKLSLLGLGKVGAQIPFGENALGVREPMRVQNATNFLGEANGVIRIRGTVGIGVPGIKIERQMMRGAVVDESFAVASVVGRESFGDAANFECGIHRLQGPRGFLVQRVKLLRGAGPE